jgi:hypothetical protein
MWRIRISYTNHYAVTVVLAAMGFSPRAYAKDTFNLFDAAIVTTSVVEVAVGPWPPPYLSAGGGAGDSSQSGLSVLRAVRLFRVFKLARGWKSMHVLLEKTRATCFDIFPFAVLLTLFMYIFALLGMQASKDRARNGGGATHY